MAAPALSRVTVIGWPAGPVNDLGSNELSLPTIVTAPDASTAALPAAAGWSVPVDSSPDASELQATPASTSVASPATSARRTIADTRVFYVILLCQGRSCVHFITS